MASEPSPSTKRKANGDVEQITQKKPRNRVSFSKQKVVNVSIKTSPVQTDVYEGQCDRQMPCSHCVARKIPELCRPYTPGKSDVDLHVRIARLEQIVELALPQYATMDRSVESRDSSPDEHSKESSYDREGRDAIRNVVRSPFLEQLQHSSLSSVLEDAPPPAARLQSLVLECGFSPHILSDLVKQLPDTTLSHSLVDYYFAAINYTRYPLYEPLFRASYQSVCLNGHNLQPSDIRFLPLLFAVLALSMRLSPDHIGGNDRMRRLTSLRLYWSSRRALLIASAIQTNSLEVILARLLGARFNIFDRRITESWSEIGAAVRTAQALGLHRDPSNLELDTFQTEYRRRIWAYVYHADRAYAFITGRPKSISDDYTSTRAPLNIDDASLESSSSPVNPQALSNPTVITFAILRHALAGIMGRIAHHFQQVQGHDPYSEVLALEEELNKFITSLPPCYSLTNPDTSFDDTRTYIPVHRFLLLTEVMFYRIGLHRPYFLRRLDADTFDRSRQACIDSAKHDTEIRRNFFKIASREVIDACGGMFRAFQSTMICGIALIINPARDDAQELHSILDNFMRMTPEAAGHETDVATQRELKIIEFLRNKVVVDPGNQPVPGMAEGPVLPNSESGSRSLGFPQSSTRQQGVSTTLSQQAAHRMPFFSALTPMDPFLPDVPNQISMTYPGDIGPEQGSAPSILDVWGYTSAGMLDGHTLVANEQWAGGSDVVPAMMFNGDGSAVSEGAGEWSYWEALVNQIRVGGLS
ncbi:hypothetical protein K439DRAFT_1650746 [Ramaria rubella]|nr:hypothetical protein K439DRAFT_1650746 [Ramaria rubella]